MRPRDIAVMAFFAGPAAAMADELTSYALQRHTLIVTAVAATIAVIGGAVSYRVLRRPTEVFEVDRFIALSGLFLNAFFLFVVLFGFGIPKLIVHPTD